MRYATMPRRRNREPFVLVQRTGPRTVGGVIAAAALMAAADGVATPIERRYLLDFLRQHGLMGVLGRSDTLARYQADLDDLREIDAADRLASRLRPLAGRFGAPLIAAAASSIAAADGVVVAEEAALLHRLRSALGLGPPLAFSPERT